MKRLLVIIALLLAIPRTSFAEETIVPLPPVFLKFSSNSTLRTDTAPDKVLRLPPGYFLDEPTYNILNDKIIQIENDRTRLTAENKVLRSEISSWRPGWKMMTAAALLGLAGGIYIGVKY